MLTIFARALRIARDKVCICSYNNLLSSPRPSWS